MKTAFHSKYVEGTIDGETRKCNVVAVSASSESPLPLMQLLFEGSPFKVPNRPNLQVVASR